MASLFRSLQSFLVFSTLTSLTTTVLKIYSNSRIIKRRLICNKANNPLLKSISSLSCLKSVSKVVSASAYVLTGMTDFSIKHADTSSKSLTISASYDNCDSSTLLSVNFFHMKD